MQRLDLIGQLVLLTGCFIFRDANGQALAYVYFEEELGRRAAAKLLTRDEAQRIAANIAKLPRTSRSAAQDGHQIPEHIHVAVTVWVIASSPAAASSASSETS